MSNIENIIKIKIWPNSLFWISEISEIHSTPHHTTPQEFPNLQILISEIYKLKLAKIKISEIGQNVGI